MNFGNELLNNNMPLLENSTLPNTPSLPDKEVLLKMSVERIKNLSKQYFFDSIRTQREGIQILWENDHLTPQEIIDALGSDALKVFQFHGALTDFIQGIAQADGVTVELKKPTNSFTVNLSAGTITVTDKPYQS